MQDVLIIVKFANSHSNLLICKIKNPKYFNIFKFQQVHHEKIVERVVEVEKKVAYPVHVPVDRPGKRLFWQFMSKRLFL